jgi:hypothetical protein
VVGRKPGKLVGLSPSGVRISPSAYFLKPFLNYVSKSFLDALYLCIDSQEGIREEVEDNSTRG